MVTPPLAQVRWPQAWRIVRSAYPPIDLFEDIADPADWELLASAEAKTNPRVRDAVGTIALVPPERRVGGPGASYVMAPFVHVSPERPSRFADGTFGAYYCGDRFEVALMETVHHFAAFLARTAEPPTTEDFRALIGTIDRSFHDLRALPASADVLAPDDYRASQALARRLRAEGSDGIVYRSVRWPAGDAVAAFWPDAVGIPVQAQHLAYRWDGRAVGGYFVYGEERWRPLPEV